MTETYTIPTKFYRIIAKTPYCGETNYYYFVNLTGDYQKVIDFASECVDDNANEWFDEEAEKEFGSWDDYLADCYCDIEEITREEYEDETCERMFLNESSNDI